MDLSASAGAALLSPPTGWPASFKENATLKAFIGKAKLKGKRCRLTGPPGAVEQARLALLGELASQSAATVVRRVHDELGWGLSV